MKPGFLFHRGAIRGFIDLNPVRADIVAKPEEYRWNSIGYTGDNHTLDKFTKTNYTPEKSN